MMVQYLNVLHALSEYWSFVNSTHFYSLQASLTLALMNPTFSSGLHTCINTYKQINKNKS